jgi:aconitate hydratase
MVKLIDQKVYMKNKTQILPEQEAPRDFGEARKKTMAYQIIATHNQKGDDKNLKLRFDSLTSHDITYVGIVQTARASGLTKFPVPYVLTNCHNSLCAVGGTLNEDDHVFGQSAAIKYGGIFVPAHQAVIHQYAREMSAACGSMILGSDSHTRYGALGCMGVGEGGPEIVKQLLSNTYDIAAPGVVAIYLEGEPTPGVGPQDVALAIIGAVYENGFVKNKIMEFVGPGIANLSVDFRNGIDVMTTETTCLSSVWATDEKVEQYYAIHGRVGDYKRIEPLAGAGYDGMVRVDLSQVKPMIALPFHPSNTYTIEELNKNPYDILSKVEKDCQSQIDNKDIVFKLTDKIVDGKIRADQGVIAGCSGGIFENICVAGAIIDGKQVANEFFELSVYPASQPVNLELIKNGTVTKLLEAGALMKTAFCGPCFGAGDVPANNGLSLRHSTRNFPNREGSKPGNGQIASVALMDARSIAASAVNGGFLTAATDIVIGDYPKQYTFNKAVYEKSIYNCWGKEKPEAELRFGPNIADWPTMIPLQDNLLVGVASVIRDPVTTTDELIPSGETSTFRSNPLKLAEFTLSRKDPKYVGRAKAVLAVEEARREGKALPEEVAKLLEDNGVTEKDTAIGTVIFANCPGDGSAREQAASCQRVLGGCANIAYEYATKRYRSNLVNWGIIPFVMDKKDAFDAQSDDYILVKGIKEAIEAGKGEVEGLVLRKDGTKGNISLKLPNMTEDEAEIILRGCLINYYAAKNKK